MRVKGGNVAKNRRKKVLKLAKGYYGSKHVLYKTAHEQVMRSLNYAYRDRRATKRNFRKLWITRINAAANQNNISYSKLMHGLKLANIDINRKMLSEIAINDEAGFKQLVETANYWGVAEWSVISHFRDILLSKTSEPQLVYTDSAGIENKIPLTFRGGIKSIFLVSDTLSYLD